MLVSTLSTLSFSFIAVILFAQSTDAMKSGELEALFALCFCSKDEEDVFCAHITHLFDDFLFQPPQQPSLQTRKFVS